MHEITCYGYMPAYGPGSTLGFTRKFPIKINVSFDNINYDPDAQFKVLVQCEPPVLYNIFADMVNETRQNFDLILTYDSRILHHKNATLFVPVGCWVSDMELEKRDQITYMMSSKILSAEHRMRFMIMTRYQRKSHIGPFEFLMHRSPPRIPSKDPFFKHAKFQIVCENQIMPNMFTEKLIDCFRTKTVPIYYGCQNLGEFFDKRGVIEFDQIDKLDDILSTLTPQHYDAMLPYLEENYHRAKSYWERNVYQRIEDEISKMLQSLALD